MTPAAQGIVPPEATSQTAAPVLQVAGLVKCYGRRRVVDDLSFDVRAGDIYGFLGPNGSGKSTTIRMLLGLVTPTAGEAWLMGHDVRSHRTAALRPVGAQVESPAFYGYLSGLRNLQLLASLTGPVSRGAIDEALARVRLAGRERDKVKTYSQGMRARLALAQALLPRPRLLVLDEPTNGLDPQGMKEVRELIVDLAAEGITVFLSTHLLAEVQQVCNRVCVIHQGRLVAEGPVAELVDGDSGRTRVRIGCRPVEQAAGVAAAVEGVADVRVEGDGLTALADAEAAAALNRALVAAGVAVWELSPQRRTLEDFFLTVTGEAG